MEYVYPAVFHANKDGSCTRGLDTTLTNTAFK